MSLSKAAGAVASVDKMPNTYFFTIASKFGHEICSNREQVELHIHLPLVLLKEAVQNNFPFSLSLSLPISPHIHNCLSVSVRMYMAASLPLHGTSYSYLQFNSASTSTCDNCWVRQTTSLLKLGQTQLQEDYECLSKPTCIIWASLPVPDGSSSLIRL